VVLLGQEEASATEIRNEIDVAASTVHYHTSKMEDVNPLESRRDG
jgi:predicted transcriptional regulator